MNYLLCNNKNEQYQDKIKNNIRIIFREFQNNMKV